MSNEKSLLTANLTTSNTSTKPSEMDIFFIFVEIYAVVVGTGATIWSWFTNGGRNDSLGYVPDMLGGPLWNFLTSIGAGLKLREQFHQAHESAVSKTAKSRIAKISAFYFVILLPLASGWGLYTSSKTAYEKGFKNVLWLSDDSLESTYSAFASNLAFSGGEALNNFIVLYSYLRARQKSEALALLNDRYDKYIAALENPNIPDEKKKKLLTETRAIFVYCQQNTQEISTEISNHEIFKKLPKENTRLIQIAENLLAKQQNKLKQLPRDMTGNLACCLGALFGAISAITQPRLFLMLSIIFYALMSAVKLFQLVSGCCLETKKEDVDGYATLEDAAVIEVKKDSHLQEDSENNSEKRRTTLQSLRKKSNEFFGLAHARSASSLNNEHRGEQVQLL